MVCFCAGQCQPSQARDFALAEIIKLTDSYRDMKINKVISAETARSVRCFVVKHEPATVPIRNPPQLRVFCCEKSFNEICFQAFADGTNYFLKMELECTSICAAPLSPASTCRRFGTRIERRGTESRRVYNSSEYTCHLVS
jgi:hypothetical protein